MLRLAHIVPTNCPRLQITAVNCGEVFSQLEVHSVLPSGHGIMVRVHPGEPHRGRLSPDWLLLTKDASR